MRYSKPGSFLFVLTDMTDGIKKWKRRALSTQNYLIMKINEVTQSSSFCCIARARILFQKEGQKGEQMMSNALEAKQLLAAKATTNSKSRC